MPPSFGAIVDYEDAYVQPLILTALKTRLPPKSCSLLNPSSCFLPSEAPLLQVRAYESIDFEAALRNPSTHLFNAYIIRKALIRKHYLSTTISNWTTKHPDSVLKDHFKPGVDFELDYAEFLDDALVEAWELRASFERNADAEPSKRDWWILKPGMSDRGQGIRLFSTEEELASIFEEWEEADPDSDEEPVVDEDDASQDRASSPQTSNDSAHKPDEATSDPHTHQEGKGEPVITSQLRHFVAQPYIHPPLLLPSMGNSKFHIRAYVLCVGALKVYVHKPMLALFAAVPYVPPWEDCADLRAHLTNTCLQDGTPAAGGAETRSSNSVTPFWSLPDAADGPVKQGWQDDVWAQICSVTGAAFEAAARGMMVHFQPVPNAFEVFGVDFLVDAAGGAWLLEVNAFPDFKQTGEELQGMIQGLWEDVVDVAVKPFYGLDGDRAGGGTQRTVKVLDIDLGRR